MQRAFILTVSWSKTNVDIYIFLKEYINISVSSMLSALKTTRETKSSKRLQNTNNLLYTKLYKLIIIIFSL